MINWQPAHRDDGTSAGIKKLFKYFDIYMSTDIFSSSVLLDAGIHLNTSAPVCPLEPQCHQSNQVRCYLLVDVDDVIRASSGLNLSSLMLR